MNSGAFLNVPATASVYVPCHLLTAYQTTAGWSYFGNFISTYFVGRYELKVLSIGTLSQGTYLLRLAGKRGVRFSVSD